MTYREFRQEEGLRLEMAVWLRSPIGRLVIELLTQGAKAKDVPVTSPSLTSARYLSQLYGYQACIDDLRSLGEPILPEGDLPAPYWGSDPEAGDHLPHQINLAKMKEQEDARNNIRRASAELAASRDVTSES